MRFAVRTGAAPVTRWQLALWLAALWPVVLGATPAHADGPAAPTVVVAPQGIRVDEPEEVPSPEEEPSPEGAVSVLVRAPDAVDPAALRASLEEDLGVRVEIVRPDEEGAARVIVELTGEDRVRLRVRRDGAPPLTRETTPGETRAGTTVTVSLLVANLVRDESGDLLSMLEIPPPPPEPPVVVVGPAPQPEPTTPEPTTPELTTPEPEPTPEPEATPELEAEPERPWIFAGIDFVPGLGFSTAYGGRERRTLSVGVVGALHGGIDGVGLSSVLDLGLGAVRGVQAAGVYSHAHRVRGVQLGGVATTSESDVRGVQGASVLALSGGELHGLQAAGVVSVAGEVRGIQGAGVLNVAARAVYGAQLATVNVSGGPLRGAQLGVVNIAGDTRGTQQGVVNIAGEVDGAQLGLVNVAGRVRGVQLGLINVAERADASVGLFSINTRGDNHLRAEVNSAGFVRTSLVHRGPVTYSLLTATVNPLLGPTGGVGFGFGVRAQPFDVFHLDLELGAHVLFHDRLGQDPADGLFEARVLGGIHLFEGFTLLVGAGFQTMLTSDPAPAEIETMPIVFDDDLGGGSRIRGWPTLNVGVELF